MKYIKLCVVFVITMSGLLIAKTGSKKEIRIEDLFKVNWESIQYNKNVNIYNPQVSTNQSGSRTNESVQLSCQVEILDANVILGICEQGIITQINDSKGQAIFTNSGFPDTRSMNYSGLRYETKMITPKRDPQWKVIMESVMQIRKETNQGPEMVSVLQPSNLRMSLNNEIIQKAGAEIGSIKGYFYALSVNTFKNIDVPFEPNDNWIQLTENQFVKIKRVDRSGNSINYQIEEQWNGGNRPFQLRVGDYLPSEILTGKRYLKADGTLTENHMFGSQQLLEHAGGNGSMSSKDVPQIQKIRYIIAQDPNSVKIPFELKNIPVPKP
jgi:hypothetical protein